MGCRHDISAIDPEVKPDWLKKMEDEILHKSPAASRSPSPVRHDSPAGNTHVAVKSQSPAIDDGGHETPDGSPGHHLPESAPVNTHNPNVQEYQTRMIQARGI